MMPKSGTEEFAYAFSQVFHSVVYYFLNGLLKTVAGLYETGIEIS